MWFVSKKKYTALLKQNEDLERIAMNAVTQNGRLLEDWDAALEEMKSIQELNRQLVERNDELLVRVKELEAYKENLELRITISNAEHNILDHNDAELCRKAEIINKERDRYEERYCYIEDEFLRHQEERDRNE